ncbi:MAG TPA: hypothetical protein VG710_09670, partial [Opitutus sp.]|nr:hypothetical protein [Opitutus sp.]
MRKLLWVALAFAGSVAAAAWNYPAARRSDHVDDYHGVNVADPYRWMEDIDSPETQAWITAERKLTNETLAEMPERNVIRARLKALWNFPHFGLPFKEGGHTFFTKNDGLQNQAVLCVQDEAASEPRVLIDPNALASDGTVALGVTAASRDGKWLAYSLKAAGSDWEELFVRDVASGKDASDRIRWVKFSNIAWTRDSRGFFYGRFPEVAKGDKLFGKLSHQQIYYHALGTAQSADRLVFELPEHPEWLTEASVSDDGRFLILAIAQPSLTQNALYYCDLGDPMHPAFGGPVVKLLDAFDANYRYVHNDGKTFFVETNANAPRGKIVAIDRQSPAPANWRTIVPESADNTDAANFFGGRFVVTSMHEVKSRLAVFAVDGKPLGEIPLPGIGAVTGVSGRDDEPELFLDFSSFLSAPTIFRHDLATGRNDVFQRAKVDFDAARYTTEQVWVVSKDGTKLPMFVTHRKDLVR